VNTVSKQFEGFIAGHYMAMGKVSLVAIIVREYLHNNRKEILIKLG